MRERPILFSAPMVRALLAGTKTQTRRVMARQKQYDFTDYTLFGQEGYNEGDWIAIEHAPDWPDGKEDQCFCPYARQRGDRLWVREAHYCIGETREAFYRATGGWSELQPPMQWTGPWKPSIHMPRWASRILLEVTDLRAQRLQNISDNDAILEGILELVPEGNRNEGLTGAGLTLAAAMAVNSMPRASRRAFLHGSLAAALGFVAGSRPWSAQPPTPKQVYALLWESINGPGSWDANPWVWAVSFKRITP